MQHVIWSCVPMSIDLVARFHLFDVIFNEWRTIGTQLRILIFYKPPTSKLKYLLIFIAFAWNQKPLNLYKMLQINRSTIHLWKFCKEIKQHCPVHFYVICTVFFPLVKNSEHNVFVSVTQLLSWPLSIISAHLWKFSSSEVQRLKSYRCSTNIFQLFFVSSEAFSYAKNYAPCYCKCLLWDQYLSQLKTDFNFWRKNGCSLHLLPFYIESKKDFSVKLGGNDI